MNLRGQDWQKNKTYNRNDGASSQSMDVSLGLLFQVCHPYHLQKTHLRFYGKGFLSADVAVGDWGIEIF